MTDNATQTKTKSFPWATLGIAFSTLAVIILFGVLYVANIRMLKDISTLETHTATLQTDVDSMKQLSNQSTDNLKQSIAALQRTVNTNPNAWRMIEAQFDVNLANTNLRFLNDVSVATQLLQLADQTIRDINDPRINNLRAALAKNISDLQAFPKVDVTGVYLKLAAVNNQIEQLPFIIKSPENTAVSPADVTNESWWKRGLQQSLAALQKIVVVRYNTSNVPPLVTPEQRDFVYQNLHAMLEKAMWALLHQQPEIYKASLQQASAWVNQFFMTQNTVTQSVLTNLNELQQIDIAPKAPTIDATQQAFHDYFSENKS